jgi:hypothetical protein
MEIPKDAKRNFERIALKRIPLLIQITNAMADRYWDEVKNHFENGLDQFTNELMDRSAFALNIAYINYLSWDDAFDNDSFDNFIEQVVGSALELYIGSLKRREVKNEPLPLDDTLMEVIPDPQMDLNTSLKEDDGFLLKISGELVEVQICKEKHVHVIFRGNFENIRNFQEATGILVEQHPIDDEFYLNWSDHGEV